MLKIRKQIGYLYTFSVLESLTLAGAWVAILAARGFSLMEISITETAYHIASLIFELPSGILADLFGRKRMLLLSVAMRMLSNLAMIFSGSLASVCLSVALTAVSDNFISGTGDALAYDSLKSVGEEAEFARYESNQLVIYRLCGGISTLCAGAALLLGYKIVYFTSLVSAVVQMAVLLGLKEVHIQQFRADATLWERLNQCIRESLSFLKAGKKPMALMFANSFVGALDVLLLFFLQAKLSERGIPQWALGIALLFMEMGGVVGARLVLKFSRLGYRSLFLLCAGVVTSGILLEHSPAYTVMALGGFLSAAADDALQVRTNALLQDMFPSQQRATLTSVESFRFSTVMVLLAPLAGVLFRYW